MIIGAVMLVMSLFGGTAGILPADFDDRVEQHVPEGARRDSIQAVAERLEAFNTNYDGQRDDQVDQFVALSQDYDSSLDDVAALLDQGREERSQAADGVIKARMELARLLRPDEWTAVFAPEDDD